METGRKMKVYMFTELKIVFKCSISVNAHSEICLLLITVALM